MLRLPVAEAFDAYLVTGGLPLICGEWGTGMDLWDHFDSALRDSTSALLVSAERALAAEFPTEVQARTVLGTIGSGERTFANIGCGSADLQHGSLNRPLQVLIDKRVVAVDQPLSSRSGGKDSRYRVADSYLRFWLAFLGPFIAEVERGGGTRCSSASGRRGRPGGGGPSSPQVPQVPQVPAVGGYWTRTDDPEIDLVVAARSPGATRILAVGSVPWLEKAPFDARDLARLIVHRSLLPGASDTTPLIAVSRSGGGGRGSQGVRARGGPQRMAPGVPAGVILGRWTTRP